MRKEFLSFSPPFLTDAEKEAVMAVLNEGHWLSSGPRTKQFEQNFRERVGANAALALNSCTAGLHLAMVVHGIKKGGEVITTPLTFAATANVVEHVGGTVCMADVDPETLLIDPVQIEKRITSKTKAIVPVHYAGQPCEMDKINALAQSCDAVVVEDAAHCMPSKIGDRWIGSGENIAVFSFYATKNMTTGEGGMMTGPEDFLEMARRLALHGMSRGAWDRFAKGGKWKYDIPEPGYKYNLTDIASAIGLVQLSRLDELYECRMKIVAMYDEAFKNSKFLRTVRVRPGVQSSHHLYVILLEPETLKIDRDQFLAELQEMNIGCSVHYTPVHQMSYYANKYGWKPKDFPNAHRAGERMLSLPLSSKMSAADAQDVIEAIRVLTNKYAR